MRHAMKITYFLFALILTAPAAAVQAQKLKTAENYNNRGLEKQGDGDLEAKQSKRDFDGAIADYSAALQLKADASTYLLAPVPG